MQCYVCEVDVRNKYCQEFAGYAICEDCWRRYKRYMFSLECMVEFKRKNNAVL